MALLSGFVSHVPVLLHQCCNHSPVAMRYTDLATARDMNLRSWMPALRAYGLALALVLIALCVRLGLTALIGLRFPLLLFLLAIMAAARFGGRGPGLVATLLSTFLVWYFLFPPRFSFAFQHQGESINLLIFVIVGTGMSLMVGQLRHAREVSDRSREALLRHIELLDKVQEPIFSWTPGGMIHYWNVGAENLYGFTRQEALGRSGHELLRTFHPLGIHKIEQLAFERRGWKGELVHRTKDGRRMVVQSVMTVATAGPTGEPSVIENNHDITERKEAEATLLRLNEDLRQFVYAASHDLQEPLRNVSLMLDLLRQSYRQKLDEEGLKLIDESVRGARRMHRMLKDLLSFTQVGTLGEELAIASLDANEVLREAIDNLQTVIGKRRAQVETEALPAVRMQRAHLLQLFQNLLGNALKYSKEDETPRIRVSAANREGEWLFAVSDNGIGFEQKYAERIFGIFKRLHQTYEYEGTGIGLAICARIVALYKGRIWAESSPGQGSTFTFSLPADSSLTRIVERPREEIGV